MADRTFHEGGIVHGVGGRKLRAMPGERLVPLQDLGATAPGPRRHLMTTAKAVVGALVALLGTVGTALADGKVTGEEVGYIVAAGIAAYGAVFAVRNRPA